MDVALAVVRVEDLRIKLAQVAIPVEWRVMQWLTVSAGVGSWPVDGGNFTEVLARAGMAIARLYDAKRRGRNCVRRASPGGARVPRGRSEDLRSSAPCYMAHSLR